MSRIHLALGIAASAALAAPAAGAQIISAPPAYTNSNGIAIMWGTTGGDGQFAWTLTKDGAAYLSGDPGPATGQDFGALPEGAYSFTVTEGGADSAGVSFTVDRTAPVVTPILNPPTPNGDNGWYTRNVAVSWSCDGGAVNCPGSQTLSAQGTNPFSATGVTDAAGNPAAAVSGSVNIDKLAPVITVPNRPSGNIQLGTPALPLVYTCDEGDTSVVVQCASNIGPSGTLMDYGTPGTGDASQLRKRTYTVDARDGAGNQSPSVTVSYTIVDTINPTAALPQSPSDGDVTNDPAPKLTWSPATDSGTGIARYRVTVDSLPAFEATVRTASGAIPEMYTVPLPPGMTLATGTHKWKVQAIDGAGRSDTSQTVEFKVDRNAPPAPALTGPTGYTTSRTPTFQASGQPGATFAWIVERVSGGTATPVQSGGPTASGTITPAPLADGQYRIRVRQRSATGNDGMYASLSFTVDATPPPAPGGLTGPGTTTSIQPSFSWGAPEAGATFRWQVLGAAGDVRLGPGATAATSLQLPVALPVGAYAFRLQQVDAAGNVSAASDAAFAIAGPAAPVTPPAATQNTVKVPALRTVNARKLFPRAGATVRSAPLLRWPRRAGATVYNVQVFRVVGTRYVKVVTAFPRANRYRMPAKKLKRGQRYVWRVWPFIGAKRRYTSTVSGQSWFVVAKNARLVVPKRVVRKK